MVMWMVLEGLLQTIQMVCLMYKTDADLECFWLDTFLALILV